VRIDALRFDIRVWVLPVPRDEENVDLVIGASTKKGLGPISSFARFIAHRIVCQEVEEDVDVWAYKAFVDQPALAKGDGPVVEYRRYAKQFYAPAIASREQQAIEQAVTSA